MSQKSNKGISAGGKTKKTYSTSDKTTEKEVPVIEIDKTTDDVKIIGNKCLSVKDMIEKINNEAYEDSDSDLSDYDQLLGGKDNSCRVVAKDNSCKVDGKDNSCRVVGKDNSCKVDGKDNSCKVDGKKIRYKCFMADIQLAYKNLEKIQEERSMKIVHDILHDVRQHTLQYIIDEGKSRILNIVFKYAFSVKYLDMKILSAIHDLYYFNLIDICVNADPNDDHKLYCNICWP